MSAPIPTPAEWIHMMQQDGVSAREFVARVATRYLMDTDLPHCISTTELAAALWPPQYALGVAVALRKLMIGWLMKCASDELGDFARRGPPSKRKFMGRATHPWLWQCPQPFKVALHCDHARAYVGTDDIYQTVATAMLPGETRAKLIEMIRRVPAQQMQPELRSAEIADVILAGASIVFN